MNLTDQQVSEFSAAFDLACKKMEGLIILEEYRRNDLNFFERVRARKAIRAFEQALFIYPESWASMLFIGKIYQRMNKHEKSLAYFESALKFEHANHNIPQEASLAAMHLNKIDKAIEYSREALRRKPADPALLGNLSMNLFIAGLDQEALETINIALTINPNDEINQRVLDRITQVISGSMKRPTFEDII